MPVKKMHPWARSEIGVIGASILLQASRPLVLSNRFNKKFKPAQTQKVNLFDLSTIVLLGVGFFYTSKSFRTAAIFAAVFGSIHLLYSNFVWFFPQESQENAIKFLKPPKPKENILDEARQISECITPGMLKQLAEVDILIAEGHTKKQQVKDVKHQIYNLLEETNEDKLVKIRALIQLYTINQDDQSFDVAIQLSKSLSAYYQAATLTSIILVSKKYNLDTDQNIQLLEHLVVQCHSGTERNEVERWIKEAKKPLEDISSNVPDNLEDCVHPITKTAFYFEAGNFEEARKATRESDNLFWRVQVLCDIAKKESEKPKRVFKTL